MDCDLSPEEFYEAQIIMKDKLVVGRAVPVTGVAEAVYPIMFPEVIGKQLQRSHEIHRAEHVVAQAAIEWYNKMNEMFDNDIVRIAARLSAVQLELYSAVKLLLTLKK